MKQRYLLSFIPIVFFMSCAAPFAPVTLHMEDGTIKKGFATENPFKKLKFKSNRDAKSITYRFDAIAEAEYNTNEGIKHYLKLPVADKDEELVVEEIATGKVSLYTTNRQGYSPGAPMGFGGAGAGGIGMGFGGYTYNIDNFYLKRDGEGSMTHLGSNQLFTKNFIKAATAYFIDCPQLIQKIEEKEYRKQDLRAIVTYFNENCD